MPRGKKKKVAEVVDATDRPEAPAKVTLAGAGRGIAGTTQKIGFALNCLTNAVTFLTSKSVYETPIDSDDPADSVAVAMEQRKLMAIKLIQRSIEISERALLELGANRSDESNSW